MTGWTESYRPDSVKNLVGNEESIRGVVSWLKGWEKSSDACLVYGPAGTGKTSISHAIANDLDYLTYEMNASDERSASEINNELHDVVRSGGFLGEKKLVIIDEVDNLDRGGVKAVREALDEATQPVILTCNEYYDGVPDSVQDRTEEFEFDRLSEGEIYARLCAILDKEGVPYEEEAVKIVAKRSEGDMRGAINDLETSIEGLRARPTVNTEKFYTMFGDERPEYVLFIGGTSVSPEKARSVLDDMRSMFDETRFVRISGREGFDIVAGEWAQRNGLDIEVHPPFDRDGLFDNEVWELRYDDLAQRGDHYEIEFYGEDPDWERYAERLSFGDVTAYGWIDEQTDPITQEIWANLECEKANLAALL